ncbi:hypothetical protein ACHAXR_007743 [Thalassiosira sp. AJA248-18]
MIQRLLCSFVCVLAAAVDVTAFSTTISTRLAVQTRLSSPALHSSAESAIDTIEDTDDVTCYVTNDEEIVTEGEKPHVVCTSEPEDYAWFNGVDNMRPTDGEEIEGTEECVEGESYKGKPEWECE